MRKSALQTLTWVTVAAAVLSAVWLSAVDTDTGTTLRQSTPRPALAPASSWPGLAR
jgi:hypothetical protein